MSIEHTAGPWAIVSTTHPGGYIVSARADTYDIAIVKDVEHTAENHANALLIAEAPELLEIARLLSLATDEGDDASQGTHYVDKAGRIRCKGSFLALIERARAALAKAIPSTPGGTHE